MGERWRSDGPEYKRENSQNNTEIDMLDTIQNTDMEDGALVFQPAFDQLKCQVTLLK